MMNKTILLLAAAMLDLASDKFSNHGCNDLDNSTTDLIKSDGGLMKEIKEYWEFDDEWEPSSIGDYMLMEILSHKFKNEAKKL